MTSAGIWRPLAEELNRWRSAGLTAQLWLRDDDAVEPTPALDRLLVLTAHHSVPVTIAVIPARTGEALARRLAAAPLATPAVHGWSHANHAPPEQRKQELGPHRPRDMILAELAAALARMTDFFGDSLVPILVPPWNRIDPALLPELPALGFMAVSVFGPAPDAGPLPALNTHVDLIDWRGTRQCRDHPALAAGLAAELKQSREGRREAIGLLGHHLVHDEAAWTFLADLFSLTVGHGACRWLPARTLLRQ